MKNYDELYIRVKNRWKQCLTYQEYLNMVSNKDVAWTEEEYYSILEWGLPRMEDDKEYDENWENPRRKSNRISFDDFWDRVSDDLTYKNYLNNNE